jgi:hypothetical protein
MTSAARANMTSAVPKIGLPSQENIPTISAASRPDASSASRTIAVGGE